MAHTHGTTREEIFAAADSIFAQGKNPTQAKVRSALGKGSFSTISKYLSEWREQQTEAQEFLSSNEEIPTEILALLKRFYGAVKASVESSSTSEQVELLETENQQLRERQANYDAIAAELTGLRYAYREAMTRLDEVIRENEQIKQATAKSSTRKPRATKQPATNT